MSKAEKTKEYIIEKSARIFNTKGYAGTSLSDIIEATGLTKGSIYGNFENKDDIAVAVFQYHNRNIFSRLDAIIQQDLKASEKIVLFLKYYRDNWKTVSDKGGCPILNASIEADDNHSLLKNNVRKSIKKWVQKLSGIIDEGKNQNEFIEETETTEYAYQIISILEGGIMLAKIMNQPKHLVAAADRIEKMMHDEMMN